MGVVALPVHAGLVLALVLVVFAGRPRESQRTGALVRVLRRQARGPVHARLRRAVVLLFAVFTCRGQQKREENYTNCLLEKREGREGVARPLTRVPGGAGALVGTQGPQGASAAVQAGPTVAFVRDPDFAQGRAETEGAVAREAGRGGAHDHVARTAVLAAGPRVARVYVLAVFSDVL